MATFSIIGNSLVSKEELLNKQISGESSMINNDLKDDRMLELGDVSVPLQELIDIQNEKKFTPIGIGKPLSIEVATVYIGEYKKFLGGKKDVVLISGVRNLQTFQATSRAVNMKRANVDENSFLEFNALEDGTNIVYYTPAMDSESMLVSFELMFDNFDTQLFETLSGLFNSAAGIPVFLPAAPYLLGGAQLLNIGSKLGDAMFSGKPNLAATIEVQFQSPILPPTEPREFIIFNDRDIEEFKDLKVAVVNLSGGPKLRLVYKSNNSVYKGKAPYLIVLLDGRKREDLVNFSATLASASMLKKFYGAENKAGEITEALQDAMKLYNDSIYKGKGNLLKERMDKLPKDSDEYKKLKNLYQAYAANIQTDNFKLPDLTE